MCKQLNAVPLRVFRGKQHPSAGARAAFFCYWFLDGNGLLYRKDGTKRLADIALVALTPLIAESKPAEKETRSARSS